MTASPRNSSTRSSVRLSSPGELLAAVPHLLGFHPRDSLVLIALGGPRGSRLGLTLRADLPPPESYRPLAEQLLGPMLGNDAVAVCLAVVGGGAPETRDVTSADLPHGGLIDVIEDVLAAADLPIAHALWTAAVEPGEAWYCYDDPDCRGELVDPRHSALAAATAVAGVVTFDSREQLAAQLRAADDETLTRRSAMLDAELDRKDPLPDAAANLALIRATLDEQGDRPAMDDEQIVRLAIALGDHVARDACLHFADGERSVRAARLWTTLVRETPAPERAEPACLLAFSAYQRGDGALAGIALDMAEQADPAHQLSALLREILDRGLPPALLAEVAGKASAEAQAVIDRRPRRRRRGTNSRRAPPAEPG